MKFKCKYDDNDVLVNCSLSVIGYNSYIVGECAKCGTTYTLFVEIKEVLESENGNDKTNKNT